VDVHAKIIKHLALCWQIYNIWNKMVLDGHGITVECNIENASLSVNAICDSICDSVVKCEYITCRSSFRIVWMQLFPDWLIYAPLVISIIRMYKYFMPLCQRSETPYCS